MSKNLKIHTETLGPFRQKIGRIGNSIGISISLISINSLGNMEVRNKYL